MKLARDTFVTKVNEELSDVKGNKEKRIFSKEKIATAARLVNMKKNNKKPIFSVKFHIIVLIILRSEIKI